MAQNKINKLELTWIGKEEEPLAVEPRLLLDTPEYSFGKVETDTVMYDMVQFNANYGFYFQANFA